MATLKGNRKMSGGTGLPSKKNGENTDMKIPISNSSEQKPKLAGGSAQLAPEPAVQLAQKSVARPAMAPKTVAQPALAPKSAARPVPAPKATVQLAPKATTHQAGTPYEKPADLYIIHGWTYTVEPWRSTLQILEANGLKVKLLKVPGLTEPSKKVFTIDDYAKWADANIPDGAIALGHSNGGRILLNLCSNKPGKLRYLILLDAAGIYEPSTRKKMVEKIARIGRPLKKIRLLDKAFHKFTGTTDYSRAPENMKQTLVNMIESDKDLKLANITTNTYILWGKKDTTTPPRQATKMYEALPNADLKFYANWTHAPYISDPTGLARALITLVRRIQK